MRRAIQFLEDTTQSLALLMVILGAISFALLVVASIA